MRASGRLLAALAVLPLALATGAAHAWRLDYVLGLQAEASDNFARRSDARSDVVLAPYGAFTLTESTPSIEAELAGDLQYRHYLRGRFDNELRAHLGARVVWTILPERLSWLFEDYLGQEPVDIFSVEQPDNLQTTNVFVTGPTLALRFSGTTRAQVEGRWVRTDAERRAAFDGNRAILALRVLHALSATNEVSGHVVAQDVRFDASATEAPDFRRYDAFARWKREGARLDVSLDGGWSTLDYADGRDFSEPLLLATARFELNPTNVLEVELARRYADATDDLVRTAPVVGDFAGQQPLSRSFATTVSPFVFVETRAQAAYSWRNERWYVRGAAFARNQEYEDDAARTLDQRADGLAFDVVKPLAGRHQVGVFVIAERREFETLSRTDRDLLIGARWRWQWLRNVALVAELAHGRRESDAPDQDYRENRALLGIEYRRGQ